MKVYLTEKDTAVRCNLFSSLLSRPFIGISVSSRLPPLDKAVQVLNLALQSPFPSLPLLIADEIAYINYRAFKHYSSGNCVKKVQHDADRQIARWQEALAHFPTEQAERVRVIRWQEILTPKYSRRQAELRAEFACNDLLRKPILALTESFIRHSGKTITEQRCLALSEYVIQELPLLLFGIEVDGENHRTLIYPTNTATPNEMQALIITLRRHPEFAALRTRLGGDKPAYAKTIQVIFTGSRGTHAPTSVKNSKHSLKTDQTSYEFTAAFNS